MIPRQKKQDVSRESIRFAGVQNLQTPATMYPSVAWSFMGAGDSVIARGEMKKNFSQWITTVSSMMEIVCLQLTIGNGTDVAVAYLWKQKYYYVLLDGTAPYKHQQRYIACIQCDYDVTILKQYHPNLQEI